MSIWPSWEKSPNSTLLIVNPMIQARWPATRVYTGHNMQLYQYFKIAVCSQENAMSRIPLSPGKNFMLLTTLLGKPTAAKRPYVPQSASTYWRRGQGREGLLMKTTWPSPCLSLRSKATSCGLHPSHIWGSKS